MNMGGARYFKLFVCWRAGNGMRVADKQRKHAHLGNPKKKLFNTSFSNRYEGTEAKFDDR
jgi:hypothetical protein